jgi:hypothetical protein
VKIKRLTISYLAKMCGVTDRTCNNWKKDGCPTIKVGGRFFYDIRSVFEWLVSSGVPEKIQAASLLEKHLDEDVSKKQSMPPVPMSETQKTNEKTDMDLYGVKDLIYILLNASKNRMAMYANNSDHARISMETNTFNKLADQFRKLDEACRLLDIELHKVVLLDDVKKVIGRAFSIMKNHFRQMPYAVADRVASMSDPKQIAEFLLASIDDGLKGCSEKIKKEKIHENL